MIELLKEFGFLNPLSGLLSPVSIVMLVFALAVIFGGSILLGGKCDAVKSIRKRNKKVFVFFVAVYLLSGILQQIGLVMIYKFVSIFIDHRWVIIVSATIFGLLHFPNFLLVFATTSLAMIFLNHFEIYCNIYYIGLLHGIMANIFKLSMPENISTSFTVWKKYIDEYSHSIRYNRVLGKLYHELHEYAGTKKHACRKHYEIITGKEILTSDIAYFTCEKQKNIPNLVINILSSKNIEYVRLQMYNAYQSLGIKEYWVVDTANRIVEVYKLTEGGKYKLEQCINSIDMLNSFVINDFQCDFTFMFTNFKLFNINPFV